MGRPKSFDREEVIAQSLAIFWQKGYAGTSVSDLMEATGLNKKSLYNEFGNKHELFKIVLGSYNDQKIEQVSLLTRKPLGKQNVKDYLFDLADATDYRGCLLSLSISETELQETDVKRSIKKSFKTLNSLILKNLEHEYSPSKAQSLSLLVSSMMFSTAGLGKLQTDKKQIQAMMKELVSLL